MSIYIPLVVGCAVLVLVEVVSASKRVKHNNATLKIYTKWVEVKIRIKLNGLLFVNKLSNNNNCGTRKTFSD